MKDSECSVHHCCWLSAWFQTQCGISQGCPFFPLSFTLAFEIPAIYIRQSDGCSRIKLPGNVLKILQYADDTILFMEKVEEIMPKLHVVDSFDYRFSGLKLNHKRCKGVQFGVQFNETLPSKIKWCLGYYTLKVSL